jgi:phosphatidylglycerophosphate synthase
MFDARLNRYLAPGLGKLAKGLDWLGLRADQVTLAGFGCGVLAGCAVIPGWFWLALGLFALNRLADGLDGALARLQGPTERGAFLDIVADFLNYGWLPLCFAFYDSANALAAAFLLFSFIGTGSSFLAYAIMAERSGSAGLAAQQGHKRTGFFYLGGLTEGAETILVLAAMLVWPTEFIWLAVFFGLACWLTTGWRIYAAWQDFPATRPPGQGDFSAGRKMADD